MGWFGEQIQNRLKNDREQVSDSLLGLSDSIFGRKRFHSHASQMDEVRSEVVRICHYFELKTPEIIPATDKVNDLIDYLVRPVGIMRRRVLLEGDWWKNGDGPLLAVQKDSGRMVALLPGMMWGYTYLNTQSGRMEKVDASNKDQFESGALLFYRPLPDRKMSGKDLVYFLVSHLSMSDTVLIVFSTLLLTLVGVLTPMITKIVFGQIIATGKYPLLFSAVALLVSAQVGAYLLHTEKIAFLSRIITRMDTTLENAVMGRLLNLPVKFFGEKSAGALSQSVGSLSMVPTILAGFFFGTCITVALSSLYVVQIAVQTPALALPAFFIFVMEIALIAVCLLQKKNLVTKQLEAEEQSQALVFSMISGIQKLKLSGSENRAFAKWADVYKGSVRASYNPPFPTFMLNDLVVGLQMVGYLLVYASAVKAHISVAQFAGFSAAFGMVSNALAELAGSAQMAAFLSPVLKKGETILQEVPENSPGKKLVNRLDGTVELNQVSFHYGDGPKIIDEMSLKIRSGEYVAIVGKSGCGKSTLMRLLLGFETPDEGAIYYGGKDLNTLDLASFRRNVGTVLQHGKLFAGDIFSNITISAPWLKMEDAWEAARMAGMDDDIRNMPMGMRTLISEGSGGISGGQRQRIMIARAIAPKPSILMFDEATSALDNLTQKTVAESLEGLKCTRIVIAHRLSTIKECDRIIVLDSGKIVEDGTYEQLIKKDGFFADLVRRQQVDLPGEET